MPVSRPKTPLFSSKRAGEYDSHACAPARARRLAARREISRGRNKHNRIRYAAGRGRPALPTASSAIKPNVRVVISSARREISRGRNKHNRIRYSAGRGRPALPTASSAIKPNVRVVISSVSREIPCGRNENKRTRTLACGGSPPRNLPRQKRKQSYTTTLNTCPQGFPAAPAHLPVAARHLACADSAPRTPVFLPFGQNKYRKVVYK